MLTCNGFTDQTVATTQRIAQCVKNTDALGPTELMDNRFELLVLDSLQRLQAGGFDFPDLTDVDACDAQEAAYRAHCSMAELATISENLPPAKVKALVLWMLNEALCTL